MGRMSTPDSRCYFPGMSVDIRLGRSGTRTALALFLASRVAIAAVGIPIVVLVAIHAPGDWPPLVRYLAYGIITLAGLGVLLATFGPAEIRRIQIFTQSDPELLRLTWVRKVRELPLSDLTEVVVVREIAYHAISKGAVSRAARRGEPVETGVHLRLGLPGGEVRTVTGKASFATVHRQLVETLELRGIPVRTEVDESFTRSSSSYGGGAPSMGGGGG